MAITQKYGIKNKLVTNCILLKEIKVNEYMTIKETAELWGVTPRWVQTLCINGKIKGAIKFGHA